LSIFFRPFDPQLGCSLLLVLALLALVQTSKMTPFHSALPGGQFHLESKIFYHFLFYFLFTDTLTRRNPKYFREMIIATV
jgi:hypothetical protein